jgi:hypothetical protein
MAVDYDAQYMGPRPRSVLREWKPSPNAQGFPSASELTRRKMEHLGENMKFLNKVIAIWTVCVAIMAPMTPASATPVGPTTPCYITDRYFADETGSVCTLSKCYVYAPYPDGCTFNVFNNISQRRCEIEAYQWSYISGCDY